MHKLTIVISLLALLVLPFSIAQEQDREHLQQLEKLNQRLKKIYSAIYDLKQQAKDTPSPEIMDEINKLAQEAEGLTRQIQRMKEKAQAGRMAKKFPPRLPKPKERHLAPKPPYPKMPEPLAPHLQQLQKKMEEQRQELKKIQEEMKNCVPEDRKYLQLLRDKKLEDLKKLQQQMNRISKPQFGPKGRRFDGKFPRRFDHNRFKPKKTCGAFPTSYRNFTKGISRRISRINATTSEKPARILAALARSDETATAFAPRQTKRSRTLPTHEKGTSTQSPG